VGGAGGDPGAQLDRERETPASRATRLKFLLPSGVALVAAEHAGGCTAVEVYPHLHLELCFYVMQREVEKET